MPIIEKIYKWLHLRNVEDRGDHLNINLEKFRADKERLCIKVAATDDGSMGRILEMHGFKVVCLFNNDGQRGLSNQIDRLLNIESTDDVQYDCEVLIYDSQFDERHIITEFTGNKIYMLNWENGMSIENLIPFNKKTRTVFQETLLGGRHISGIEYIRQDGGEK